MKWSIYNHYVEEKNDYIIYNYLSKKIIKINNFDMNIRNLSYDATNELKELGFLVDEGINEKDLAKLKYIDYVHSNELILILFPTEDCNFRCTFCYENFNGKYMNDEILNSTLLFLRKNITKYSNLYIDWFGGEPLLAKKFIYKFSETAIKICQSAKIPYRAGITTNGYLLDKETMQTLLKYKITSYHITLCGDEKSHDAIRYLKNGQGTFQVIIKNLLDIKQIKSKVFRIQVRINVTKGMLNTLGEFLKWLAEKFGDDERFSFYFRPVGDWGGNSVNSISSELNVNHTELFQEIFCANAKLNYDIYYELLTNELCAATKRNEYVIRANGDINKCSEALYDNYNKVGVIDNLGNMVLNESLLAKWFFTYSENESCKKCIDFELCHNRKCPNNNFETGDKQEKYCGYEKIAINEVLKLLEQSGSKYIHQICEEKSQC